MKSTKIVCSAMALALSVVGVTEHAIAQGASTGAPKASAPGKTGAVLPASDVAFVKKAAMGNMVEVQLGELAGEKATSPEVKAFAEKMVADHGKAQEELKALADAKGVELPVELDAKHKSLVEKLSKLSGAEFDKAYGNEMRKDHKKAVSEYQDAMKSLKDPELKGYAEKTLPALQQHLEAAKDLGKGGKGKAGEKAAPET